MSRQPFGRIPVIEHNGFALYETQAILRYIERLTVSPCLVLAEPRAEARMNQFMGICDWYGFPQVTATICFARLIAPRFGRPVDEARAASGVQPAHAFLTAIDALMDEGAYLVGDAITLADIMLLPHLESLGMTPEGGAAGPVGACGKIAALAVVPIDAGYETLRPDA